MVNFKNYGETKIAFAKKINLIYGKNGVGKTNLLDAIYYLCFCKSYFNASDSANIRHEQGFFRLVGEFDRLTTKEEIIAKVAKGKKKVISRNQSVYDKFSQHIGLCPLVIIAPDDTELIRGASELRRKLINTTLAQLDTAYLKTLIRYNRVLQQRNALLKQFAEQQRFNPILLETYTTQLIPLGETLHQKRQALLQQMSPVLQRYYEYLSQGKEKVRLDYQSQLNDNSFAELLKNTLSNDRHLNRTTTGIHRDNLLLTIEGYPLKKFGSQGQQKSFIVALKLAVYQLIQQHQEIAPILLLDDIFDKLDATRTSRLVDLVSGEAFGQLFISDTQLERIAIVFDKFGLSYRSFEIQNGQVSKTLVHET